MTVVFDSNLYVSTFQYGGIATLVLRKAFLFDDLLVCEEIGAEVLRVMQKKFARDPAEVARLLADAWRQAKFVSIPGQVRGVCRDPNDDYLLDCAVAGRADLIVTGDKDLLALERYEGVRIVTPRQYLEMA